MYNKDVDKSNMLRALEEFPYQCKMALELSKGMSIPGDIENIVIAGMGGSAVGGDLLRIYMRNSRIPVHVLRDYRLPGFVNEKTLFFAISYSGNTEETISSFNEAEKRKAKIVAVTSGGILKQMAKRCISIPAGLQPRAALGYLFFPALGVLDNSGIIKVKNDEISEMLGILGKTDDFRSEGERLAKKIGKRTPVIYASENMYAIAYRWKTQFNENGKMPAFHHTFSEMNHNEIVGYQNMQREDFISIIIRDKDDNERIRKRMDITKEIMSSRVDVEEISTKGEFLLSRLFSGIYYGDFASYYAAIANKIDPSPVTVIENLKKRLNQ